MAGLGSLARTAVVSLFGKTLRFHDDPCRSNILTLSTDNVILPKKKLKTFLLD